MTIDYWGLSLEEVKDLGDISAAQRDIWEHERGIRMKYRQYFDGSIFAEKVPLEVSTDETETPLLYPVGLNLVKVLCLSQAAALFGEWEDDIVRFEIRRDSEESEGARRAVGMCQGIFADNDFAALGYELALDRELYGGCAIKVAPDFSKPHLIGLSHIHLDYFYPIWDPDNPDLLLEAYIAVPMTREQCKAKYGYDPQKDVVLRIEKWTRAEYTNTLDGKRIDAYSGINRWGIVPITFIPRYRCEAWYGEPLTPDIIPAQDEMNMRIADIGEGINYNSHPTRWGVNLPRGFNSDNFSLDPGAMWDLGKSLSRDAPVPAVGMLEAENPVPERVMDFVKFVYDWGRTVAHSPPIAFGEDQGGGQRSGRTLEIRMWPLLQASKRSRAYMAAGITRIIRIASVILQQKKIADLTHATNRVLDGTIIPSFWPMMPKDQTSIVDMVVKLLSTPVPIISLEEAQKLTGYGPAEMDRVRAMLNDPDFEEFFERPGADEPAPVQPKQSAKSV